jgi:very-short-patch-repair endonuclease
VTSHSIERRLERGHWAIDYESVYVVGGAPDTWYRRLWAACLWAGDGAFFSGRTGVLLHELDGVREQVVELTTMHRTAAPNPHLRLRVTTRPPSALDRVHGLPVAPVARTLVDFAAVDKVWNVELALDDAIRKKMVTVGSLGRYLADEGRGLWGAKKLRLMLVDRTQVDSVLSSPLETKFAKLLATSNLPKFERHYLVRLAGGQTFELDFAYPRVKLGIETDGYRWHSGKPIWQQDLDRANALAEAGWLILRFSWNDVHRRPGYVIARIGSAFAVRKTFLRCE